jgi:hypothetical protein
MLSEAQIAKARTFPGCGDMNAENALDKLFAAADGLQGVAKGATDENVALNSRIKTLEAEVVTAQAAAPKQTPPEVLKAMAFASRIHLKDAIAKQAITPAASESLASVLIGTDEKLSAVGLTPNASGECVASLVFGALATNGAAPNVGKEANGQPAPKATPGAPEEEKPMTKERRDELLAMARG